MGFKNILRTCSNAVKSCASKPFSANLVAVIIESSNQGCDGFAEDIENKDNKLLLRLHASCCWKKTSKSKIVQHIKAKGTSEDS